MADVKHALVDYGLRPVGARTLCDPEGTDDLEFIGCGLDQNQIPPPLLITVEHAVCRADGSFGLPCFLIHSFPGVPIHAAPVSDGIIDPVRAVYIRTDAENLLVVPLDEIFPLIGEMI